MLQDEKHSLFSDEDFEWLRKLKKACISSEQVEDLFDLL